MTPEKPISGPHPTLRLITVDLDDTLWECTPVIRRAEQVLYTWLQDTCPIITEQHSLEAMRERRFALAEQHAHLRHDVTALRRHALALHMQEAGYDQALVEEAFQIFLAARNEVELYDDVRPVLLQLRRHYTLAALTNGNASIELVGLHDVFHFALSPADVGTAKPDPAMFHRACQQAGVSPRATVHIGDSAECDIRGGHAAGVRTVWMNRNGVDWPENEEAPHAEIRSLHDLPAVLLRL